MTNEPPTEPPQPHHAVNLVPAVHGIAKSQLRAVIERIENLETEKAIVGEGIKDVYVEAKANGFDVKALRTVIRLRAMDKTERREAEAILDAYLNALGML